MCRPNSSSCGASFLFAAGVRVGPRYFFGLRRTTGRRFCDASAAWRAARSVAVAKCADDTKGQTCYICTQALHWKTKEGLVRGCACRGTAGFAHVSCLAEQAKILNDEGEANNLSIKGRWERWSTCSLCEQDYHGVVSCALGWACWKTYVDRPETDSCRIMAMNVLGNGLTEAGHYEDALSVREAELSMYRRLGAPEESMLVVQGNLANTYESLGRPEKALTMQRDVYSGRLKLNGEEHPITLRAADNYAITLGNLQRYAESKAVLRKIMPLARRVLGESHELTLTMRQNYGAVLCNNPGATLDDTREAVTTLEESERVARHVYGGAHPLASGIEHALRNARAALRARETPPPRSA